MLFCQVWIARRTTRPTLAKPQNFPLEKPRVSSSGLRCFLVFWMSLYKDYPEGAAKFKFKTTKRFYDALSRQADEAVRINNASSAHLINSKSEFNSAPMGRVKLDKPWKLRRD